MDEYWASLKDLPLPSQFEYIFRKFMDIRESCQYDFSGNIIFTPRQILDYEECFGLSFSYYERTLLMKMKTWASIGIAKASEPKNK